MAPQTQILLSGMLTFGIPLVFAMRELIVLRRPPRSGPWQPPGQPPAPPMPKPLPDCLIPKRIVRPKVLEDA